MWGDRDDGDYDVNAFAYGFDVFSNVVCLKILLYLKCVFSLIFWDQMRSIYDEGKFGWVCAHEWKD